MHSGDNKEYKIEDLPEFFQSRSEEISKIFSDKFIEISTIRSERTENAQKFSFKLELLPQENASLHGAIFHRIGKLIEFFKPCLKPGKFFTYSQNTVGKMGSLFSRGLHIMQGQRDEVEKEQTNILVWSILRRVFGENINSGNFSSTITTESIRKTFSMGITIELQARVNDIENLNKIELFSNKKSSKAEETQNAEKSTATNDQIVLRGSFGKKNTTGQPEIISYFKRVLTNPGEIRISFTSLGQELISRFTLPSLVLTRLPKLSKTVESITNTTTSTGCLTPGKRAELAGIDTKLLLIKKKMNSIQSLEETRIECKKLLVEMVSKHATGRPDIFLNIFNEVFETIYLNNKNFSVAELLEIPADAENMEWQIELKKRGLFTSLFLPKPKTQNNSVIKQPNNPLKNILTSYDTHIYLSITMMSTSALCLLHFTEFGKSVISKKNVALTANVVLPILIALSIIGISYVIYSEYTVSSVEQVNKGNLEPYV